MKISGFSFVRNGVTLSYPVVESVRSILPIVDEYVIAVGEGDADDTTRKDIAAIGDPKLRIIDTRWEEKYFDRGIINAMQTDIAKNACSGDWLFYLQADEVVHERYLPVVQQRCAELLGKAEIEGLLFRYKHFWGDYSHYHTGHGWYPREIRVIRNRTDIHSWQSAQSFRRFDHYENPRQPDGHHKLTVASVEAEIYHYGWVRPPDRMQIKNKALNAVHHGPEKAEQQYNEWSKEFDYGPLDRLGTFRDTHPRVMQSRIAAMDWKDKLQITGRRDPARKPHKHERLKYRFLSLLERTITGGRQIGGFRNYRLRKDV
jgi:hypothetical protein